MNSRKKKSAPVTIVLMAAAVVLIFLVIHFQRKVDSTTIKGGAYNYFGDTKVEYNGSVKLQYKDGTVTAKTEKGKEILDSTPLYDGDGNGLLPRDYIWYDLETGKIKRISHFASFETADGVTTIKDGNKTAEQARGFLFDGTDTYVFLESVILSAGDEKKTVPALSYAVARYGNSLQFYEYKKDGGESTVLWCGEEEQKASFTDGTVVDLGTDTMYLKNGTWQLLMGDPQVLDTMD
ncbi:MAG: hypothetical protein SOZ61_09270 [Candidatus Copromonas sp.]|nr:hypothetical protein [Candidatus Copromonas sp.]